MGDPAAEISVRLARAEDASAVASIHTASWRDAYASILDPEFLAGPVEADRLQLWAQRLSKPPAGQIVLVASVDGGEPVAFICLHIAFDPTWGSWIDNLHVLPGLRGRAIGKKLLKAAMTTIEDLAPREAVHLWVFEANADALRFYQRLGGVVVEEDISKIPSARGAKVLRVHWPGTSAVGDF